MANPKYRQPGKEYGVTGTQKLNGIITGEEYSRELTGLQALQTYDVMSRSDSAIHSILEVVKLPIIAANWNVKPAKDKDGKVTPADQEIADHLEYELFHHNLDFDDLLYQALDMLDYGFSVFEKCYSFDKEKMLWGIDKIAFRKQTTIYAWQQRDGTPGITQMTIGSVYDIPMDKLCVFTNKKRGDNYQGISLLRYVFKDWDLKDKLTLVNALALEKLGVGVPVISEKENETVNQGDVDKAELAMQEFRANEKGYIKSPRGMLIEMLDMKGQTTKDIIPTLNYHKREIFSSVLATFLDLGGSSGSGAQSLSKDLTSLFLKSEEYIAKTIRSVFNQQIIKQICDWNYSNLENGYPELTYGKIGDEDIVAMATALNSLITAGAVTPDIDIEDHLRTQFSLPAMSDDMKARYDEAQKMKHEAAKNAIEIGADPNADPNADPKDPNKKTTPKEKQTKAAINAMRAAQRKYIDVIYQD